MTRMSMSIIGATARCLFALFVFCSAWLASGPAWAAPAVSIELSTTDNDQRPTHVCVIHGAKTGTTPALRHLLHEDNVLEEVLSDSKESEPDAKHTKVKIRAGAVKLSDEGHDTWPGLIGLWADKSDYRSDCTTKGSNLGCNPEFYIYEPEQDFYLQCVAEGGRNIGSEVRLAVVAIESTASETYGHVEVSNLTFLGSRLEFDTSLKLDKATLLITVRGGYYIDVAPVKIEKDVKLDLKPRCAWVKLELPTVLPLDEVDAGTSTTPAAPGESESACMAPKTSDAPGETVCHSDTKRTRKDALEGRKLAVRYGYDKDDLDVPVAGKRQSIDTKCLRGDNIYNDLQVLMPVSVDRPSRLVIEHGNLDAGEPVEQPAREDVYDGIWLEYRWDDETPDRIWELDVHNFTFSWRREQCFYQPTRDCPQARIHESGLECRLINIDDKSTCYYSCPGEVPKAADQSIGLVPPRLSIDFEDKEGVAVPGQLWELRLQQIDQQLVGHVARQHRAISLTVGKHPSRPRLDDRIYDLDRLGDAIYAVELEYGNGKVVAVSIDTQKTDTPETDTQKIPVAVPGAECQEPIRYRYIGDRRYRSGIAHIENGELQMKAPSVHGRQAYFAVDLGAGAIAPRLPNNYGSSENSRFLAAGQIAVGFNQLVLLGRRACKEGARDCGFHPVSSARGLRIEYRVFASYSAAVVQPINLSEAGKSSDRFRRVPYWRVGGRVSVMSPWLARRDDRSKHVAVSLGGGPGLYWGHPARWSDSQLFDRRWQGFDFGVLGGFDLRVRLFRYPGLQLFFRHEFMYLEHEPRYSTDYSGTPEVDLRENRGIRQGLIGGITLEL